MTTDSPAQSSDQKREEDSPAKYFESLSKEMDTRSNSGEFNYTKIAAASASMVKEGTLPNTKTSC